MKYNTKMNYFTKSQSQNQQNQLQYQLSQYQTINERMFATDLALSRALDNISQLQQNLAYMIQLNLQLKQENQKLKINSEKICHYVKSEEANREKEIKQLGRQHEEVIELLQITKKTLLDTESELAESRQEVERCNRIISQQKKAYEQLEQTYMNQQLSYLGEGSQINITKTDINYINELQKQNSNLQIQLKRQEQLLQKNDTKIQKLQKQNNQFKKWIASILKLQKVVQGTQKILLEQIKKRIIST